MAKYQMVNVGRSKVTREFEADNELQIIREVKKHLASNGVDLSWNKEGTRAIVCAGFHTVGEVLAISA